jgi:deoxyribodipyrimidine photolyase
VSAIVWFRRDLRLHEHPALRAALDAHNDACEVFFNIRVREHGDSDL